jgi:hypothetical protein
MVFVLEKWVWLDKDWKTASQAFNVSWVNAVDTWFFAGQRACTSISFFALPKAFEPFHALLPRRT